MKESAIPTVINPPDRARNTEKPGSFPSTLYIASPHGFCAGIVNTVKGTAMMEERFPDQKRYLVGTPAHNATVIEAAEKAGWEMVDSITAIPDGAIAALGPHGSTEEDIRIAKAKKLTFIDTECPLVTDVKDGIREALADNYTVILWAKEGHAETRAHLGVPEELQDAARERLLLGRTTEQMLSEDFLERVRQSQKVLGNDVPKVAFFAQTTHNADEAEKIRAELAEKFEGLMSLKTGICYATRDRQFAISEMKKVAGIMGQSIAWLVIGDPTSSNSNELLLRASADNTTAIFALNASKLDAIKDSLLGFDAIAITAGASSPEEDIDDAVKWCVDQGTKKVKPLLLGRDESRIKFADIRIQEAPYSSDKRRSSLSR